MADPAPELDFGRFLKIIPIPTPFRPDPDPLVDFIPVLDEMCNEGKQISVIGATSVRKWDCTNSPHLGAIFLNII